jgi:hypothetical protein
MLFFKKIVYISSLFILFLFLGLNYTLASNKIKNKCEYIINKIESLTEIPKGLLLGIGKTEAGRVSSSKELVVWPWTVNHAGKSLFFDNKKQMSNYVLKHFLKGDNNLDVGCMQINLKWHKQNFKKVSDMFSIEPNISYAASFLLQLKNKYNTWDEAIKHYHSSDPIKNKPYLKKVAYFWKKKDKKVILLVNSDKKQVLKPKNSLTNSIKSSQPYLFARMEKVIFFRKIFSQK